MDPLSDIFTLLRPRSYITAGLDAGGDWAIRFDDMSGRIKCYSVASGSCWLAVDGVDKPARLTAGDCFVVASGRSFVLASDLAVAAVEPQDVFGDQGRVGGIATFGGGGGVFLTGSRFTVEGRHAHLLLGALPPIILLEADANQVALRWSIERMMDELRDNRPGAALMAEHLSHIMLLQTLRLHLARDRALPVGWFAALADPQITRAIGAIHADPARRWTLTIFAKVAGMSRSLFAQRFRQKVGETPIAYLTRWRMVLAGNRLVRSDDTLSQTARALGYECENAFNTAFKRVMGVSPRRYSRGETKMAA